MTPREIIAKCACRSDWNELDVADYAIEVLTAAGYSIIHDSENHGPTVERTDAFETVAQWHDKNARLCLSASKDDPRLNDDDRRRAFEAHRHHAASAAAIRSKMIGELRAMTTGGRDD